MQPSELTIILQAVLFPDPIPPHTPSILVLLFPSSISLVVLWKICESMRKRWCCVVACSLKNSGWLTIKDSADGRGPVTDRSPSDERMADAILLTNMVRVLPHRWGDQDNAIMSWIFIVRPVDLPAWAASHADVTPLYLLLLLKMAGKLDPLPLHSTKPTANRTCQLLFHFSFGSELTISWRTQEPSLVSLQPSWSAQMLFSCLVPECMCR